MTETLVHRTDRDGGLTILTLNRPDKLNALNLAVFAQLREHLVSIAGDQAVGCAVLQGAGPAFSAGADLGREALNEHEPHPHFEVETVDALEALPCPTIARLHGDCLTGGLELALGCDLLVAGSSTTFADAHGT
jgi:enoyl-CoA hydratase/carnithine racemase